MRMKTFSLQTTVCRQSRLTLQTFIFKHIYSSQFSWLFKSLDVIVWRISVSHFCKFVVEQVNLFKTLLLCIRKKDQVIRHHFYLLDLEPGDFLTEDCLVDFDEGNTFEKDLDTNSLCNVPTNTDSKDKSSSSSTESESESMLKSKIEATSETSTSKSKLKGFKTKLKSAVSKFFSVNNIHKI